MSLSSIDFVRLEVLNDGTPAYIDAISVVPEPATWTLAMTGAGLVFTPTARLITCASGLLILWGLVAASIGGAATLAEDFSSDPQQNGWKIFGDTNLFQWDSTNQNLDVTWDSSQTNSYFYHALGTILAGDDNFHLSFDLTFQDYASGTTPGKPYDFEAAIGFLNLANAMQTNFSRGAGINPTYGPDNLVEFDFFPAFSIYQPTISQVIVSTNNAWLYNNNNPLDLTPGQLFHVDMDYNGATRTLTTTVTNNGVQYGMTQTILVPTNFDFRVTAVSVSSYSDQNATGSILAHGTVDNFVITVPPSPVQNLTGSFTNGVWQAQFLSRSNWLYTLQRSADFQSWTNVSSTMPGNATNLFLQDASPPTERGVLPDQRSKTMKQRQVESRDARRASSASHPTIDQQPSRWLNCWSASP